jgi:hypothetical protein
LVLKDKKKFEEKGPARICYNDNSIYEGVIRKGKKDGYGRLILGDGSMYEGLFKDDLYWGNGILYNS